ncbi:MAG TPA: hypothetical protein V6C85_05195 [Allocoleopsis sp.]
MNRLKKSETLAAQTFHQSIQKKGDSEALLRSPYSPSGILRQALPKASADRSHPPICQN